jgi:hypothetical protein
VQDARQHHGKFAPRIGGEHPVEQLPARHEVGGLAAVHDQSVADANSALDGPFGDRADQQRHPASRLRPYGYAGDPPVLS